MYCLRGELTKCFVKKEKKTWAQIVAFWEETLILNAQESAPAFLKESSRRKYNFLNSESNIRAT